MTDRSLLYTSATRPTERLVIVGDLKDIQEAVNRGNVASARKVCLGGLISQRVAAIPHPDPASGSCSDERSCLPDAKQVREKGARPDCDSPNAVEADDFTQNYTRS